MKYLAGMILCLLSSVPAMAQPFHITEVNISDWVKIPMDDGAEASSREITVDGYSSKISYHLICVERFIPRKDGKYASFWRCVIPLAGSNITAQITNVHVVFPGVCQPSVDETSQNYCDPYDILSAKEK